LHVQYPFLELIITKPMMAMITPGKNPTIVTPKTNPMINKRHPHPELLSTVLLQWLPQAEHLTSVDGIGGGVATFGLASL